MAFLCLPFLGFASLSSLVLLFGLLLGFGLLVFLGLGFAFRFLDFWLLLTSVDFCYALNLWFFGLILLFFHLNDFWFCPVYSTFGFCCYLTFGFRFGSTFP